MYFFHGFSLILEALCKPIISYFTPIFLTLISYIFEQKIYILHQSALGSLIELCDEKTCLWVFWPGPTQTGLYGHRRWLMAWKFGFRKYRNCTIYIAKTKAADLRFCFCNQVFSWRGSFLVQTIMKESQHLQDTKERQIQELRQMVEETNTTKKHEFEKKVGNWNSIVILSFRANLFEQTVQTQIRLL